MRLVLNSSLSCAQSQDMFALSHVKRDTIDTTRTVLPTIIVTVVFVAVFTPLLFLIYKAWKLERANGLKKQQAEAKEEGPGTEGFKKAELSSGSSVIVNEMETPGKIQELPESKEGLSHELPGSIILPQELPAAVHEMSAEYCDNRNEAAKPNMKLASGAENMGD